MKKKLLLYIIISFIIIFIVGAYFFLKSSYTLEKIRSIAESKISDQIKREASIGGITGNLFSYLTINNIAIAKNDVLSKGKLIEIESIETDYSILNLFRLRFDINQVKINKPKVNIEIDKNGKLNIPKLTQQQDEKSKGSRLKILLKSAQIVSGTVYIDDKRDSASLFIDNADGKISGNIENEYIGEFLAKQGQIKFQNISKSLSNMTAKVEVKGDEINLSSIDANIASSNLKAYGKILNAKTPQVNINAIMKIVLNDFRELAPQIKRLDGNLELDLMASGKIDDISGTCLINSDSIFLNDLNAKNLNGKAEFSLSDLELPSISVELGKGRVDLNATAHLSDGKLGKFKGIINLKELDTNKLLTDFNGISPPFSGSLSGKLTLIGDEILPGKFNAYGDFNIIDTMLSIPESSAQNSVSDISKQQKQVNIGKVDANLNISKKDISMNIMREQTNIDIKGKLSDDASLGIKMNLNGLGLNEVSEIVMGAPSLDGNIQIIADTSMKIANPAFLATMGIKEKRQSSKLVKDLSDLKGKISINIPNISIPLNNDSKENPKFIQVASLNGSLKLDDNNIKTDQLKINLNEGECLVDADIQLNEVPYLRAKVNLASISIENYAKALGGNLPVYGGVVNGQIDLAGKTTDLNGDGEVIIHDLFVSTRGIDPIIMPIMIRSNGLKIPELVISSIGEQIRTELDFSPTGDYSLKVESSPIDISKLYADAITTQNIEIATHDESSKIPTPGGNIQISLSGKGNIKKPSLNGSISLNDLRFNGEVFGNGECLINIDGDKALFDVYLFDRTMEANLISSIKKPFPFTAQLQMKDINVEPALRLAKAGEKLDLRITGDIRASGKGEYPMDTFIDGAIQNISLLAGQYKWINKSPIKFNLSDRKFAMDMFQMEGDGAKLTVNANAKLSGNAKNQKIEINADAVISDFDLAVASDILELPTQATGKLNISAKVKGDVNSPNATIQIVSPGIDYDKIKVDDISGFITYKENMIEIENFIVKAFDGQTNIKFNMPFDLKTDASLTPEKLAEKSLHLTVNVKDIDLSRFSEFSPNIEKLNGKVDSINLDFMGSLNQPRVNASVNIKDGFAKIKDTPVPLENLNGRILLQNSRTKIDEELYEVSNRNFDTSFSLAWMMDKGNFNMKGVLKTPRDFVEYIAKANAKESSEEKPKVSPYITKFISSMKEQALDVPYPELNLDVSMNGTQVGPWIKGMLKDMEVPLDGEISSNVHIEGTIFSPNGTILVEPVKLLLNNQIVENSEPISINIKDRIANISSFKLITKQQGSKEKEQPIGTIAVTGLINADSQEYNFSCKGENLHPKLASFVLNQPKKQSPENPKAEYDPQTNTAQINLEPTDGNINFDIESKGLLNSPNVILSASVANLTIPVADKASSEESAPSVKQAKEAKIDKILCALSYNDGMINLERFNINTFGNTMNASGKIPADISIFPTKVIFPDKDMNVKLIMDNFTLGFLSTFVENIQEFDGNANADIDLSGSIIKPKLLGSLKLLDAKCSLIAIKSTNSNIPKKNTKTTIDIDGINFNMDMDSDKIAISDASFKIGEGKYKAYGNLKLGEKLEPQDFEFVFKTEPAKLEPFVLLGGDEIASKLSGDIKVDGNLKGDFRNFKDKTIIEMIKSLNGTMNITPEGIDILMAGHKIANPKRVYIELKKGRINLPSFKIVDVTPGIDNGTSIAALGMWEIGGEKSFDLTAFIDAKLISDFVNQPNMTMQGGVGFKVEARGNEVVCFWPPIDNEKYTRLTFQNASIDKFEGRLAYKNQNLDIKQVWLTMGDNKVSISGFVPLNGKQMSLQMDARMNDMSILSLINKEISESSGKATIGATVTGDIMKVISYEEPIQFTGSCTFEKLNANFERAYADFENINGNINFNSKLPSAIEINELRGKLNDGEFILATSHKPGISINWNKGLGYKIGEFRNIALSVKDCTIYQPQVYSIVFDADPVQLRGSYDTPKLTGNITLKEGLYNESLQSLIQNMVSSREIGVKAVLDYPIVKNLILDINLTHGNIRMDNGLIDADAEIANARVTGSLADPLVRTNGRINQGKFTYLSREFTIKKGEFSNDGTINPKYEILAETELANDQSATGSNVKVQMEIKGSLTERYPPNFTILGGGGAAQATPDLSQNQIAAIIALGISPDQSLSRAFSSSPLLVEPAKQYFESQAEKMLRLKEFKMQVDPRNPRETRLNAAKQLTEDVSVTLDVGYGGRQWIGLQRELVKNIAIAGKISQEGDWGFDLKVEREFQ